MDSIPQLMMGAAPQFYRGNSVGCLVVHGFMASPAEVGWAGQHLAEQGYTVYVPRLTGHGIDPDHMKRMRWQDWYAQVIDGYHLLRAQCEQVVVVGHSMGGLLALLLASQHPLEALVVSAAPMTLTESDIRMQYAKFLGLMIPYTHHPSEPELNAQIIAEQEKRGEAVISRVHYEKWSSRAVQEFSNLEQIARAHLAQVTSPLLLLYAEQDQTGTVADADLIAQAVQSAHIEQHILKEGAHIIFQDAGRNEAFAVVADFVKRMVSH